MWRARHSAPICPQTSVVIVAVRRISPRTAHLQGHMRQARQSREPRPIVIDRLWMIRLQHGDDLPHVIFLRLDLGDNFIALVSGDQLADASAQLLQDAIDGVSRGDDRAADAHWHHPGHVGNRLDHLADLLEVVEDRHKTSSTIVTTQLDPDQWHAVIGDATVADSICDRLVHNAHRVKLVGESIRKTQGLTNGKKPTK